jgi:uncharacterized cupredoxin-like copper-binding protein
MRFTRLAITGLMVALILLGGGLGTAGQGSAQEGSPSRPSHIHEGDCDEPGSVVNPLTFLTVPGGATSGNSDAVLAEAAFSNIPLTLDQMLATDHSLKVHLSAEQIEVYLVCGDIGGAVDADGALIVGLKEQDGSGYTGIAYLVPAANGTNISVMIAKVLPGGGIGDDSATTGQVTEDEGAADEAADVNVVGVRLSNFAIDMPTELPAGPTQFNITSLGPAPHNFVIEGNGISERLEANLDPQRTGQLTVDLQPGTYTIFCPVGEGGHRAQGMEVTLTVTGDGAPAPQPEAEAPAAAGPNPVAVTLGNFFIDMPTAIPAGPTVFNVTSQGPAPHNLVIEGNGITGTFPVNLAPGESGQLTLDLPPGTYVAFCPVGEGGHRAQGMEVTFTVQ